MRVREHWAVQLYNGVPMHLNMTAERRRGDANHWLRHSFDSPNERPNVAMGRGHAGNVYYEAVILSFGRVNLSEPTVLKHPWLSWIEGNVGRWRFRRIDARN